ncbi:MAG TPA: hypothetical protein VHM19_22950 [Polyangiales bacterium]|jgi:hypothetical protein|nr:hypothetical protein [Polyangiales bacterium]
MATATVHFSWFEDVVEGANCGSDSFVYALTAAGSAPTTANTQLTDLTQISYTNLSSRTTTTSSSSQSSGTYKLILADLVLTASGGSVAAFRYLDLYDDTMVNDKLVLWYDYGSALTLASGETLTIDHDGTNGVFTVS